MRGMELARCSTWLSERVMRRARRVDRRVGKMGGEGGRGSFKKDFEAAITRRVPRASCS